VIKWLILQSNNHRRRPIKEEREREDLDVEEEEVEEVEEVEVVEVVEAEVEDQAEVLKKNLVHGSLSLNLVALLLTK
jgi:hypothetical protein